MKLISLLAGVVMCLGFGVPMALGEELSTEEIMKELKALQDRVGRLETELKKKDLEIERLQARKFVERERVEAPNEMKDRLERIEKALERKNREMEIHKAQSAGQPGGKDETPAEDLVRNIWDQIAIGGLAEAGAVYDDTKFRGGRDMDSSDITLTTVEIGLGVKANEWVNLETVFLYEDAPGNAAADEADMSLDVGTVTFGNPEKFPLYLTAGKMYVPYGAILTHFPDDPLVDQPMTLAFGEINEKAVLVGYEANGLSTSAYVFKGEADESASDNSIEHYGADVRYTFEKEGSVEWFTGLSYISSIAEGLGGIFHDTVVKDYTPGAAAYVHLGVHPFFFEAEYMTALEEFDPSEISTGNGDGAKPSAWNFEVGYNWNWGRNLEIALQYAGSDETGAMGYADNRYGICFNQEIFENIVGSVACYRDDLHRYDVENRDKRNVLVGQVAIAF